MRMSDCKGLWREASWTQGSAVCEPCYCNGVLLMRALCSSTRPRIELRETEEEEGGQETSGLFLILVAAASPWHLSIYVVFPWWWWHSTPFWYGLQWLDCVRLFIGKASLFLSLCPFPFSLSLFRFSLFPPLLQPCHTLPPFSFPSCSFLYLVSCWLWKYLCPCVHVFVILV